MIENLVYPVLFRSGTVQLWGPAHELWPDAKELPQVQETSQGVTAFVWHPPQVQRRHDRRHTAGLPVLCPHWWLCSSHGQKKTEDCHQHNERRGWVRFCSVLQTRTGSLPAIGGFALAMAKRKLKIVIETTREEGGWDFVPSYKQELCMTAVVWTGKGTNQAQMCSLSFTIHLCISLSLSHTHNTHTHTHTHSLSLSHTHTHHTRTYMHAKILPPDPTKQ